MRAAWLTIAQKDLRLLARDRMALFWVLGFPLVFAAFFGSVMRAGIEADTAPLVVMVLDAGPPALTERLAAGLTRAGMRVRRADEASARHAVRRAEAVAYVGAITDARGPRLALGIDPARRTEGALLEGVLHGLFTPATASAVQIERAALRTRRDGPNSGFELVFPAMVLWGLLGCAAAFAVALVSERTSGTLLRLRAAPIGSASILGGKTAACAIACALTAVFLSAIGLLALSVRIADPGKYAAALGACVACFTGITMLLSVLGESEQAVAGAGWSTLILLAMLGGAMVPLSVMPEWLLSWSEFSPVRWGIRALEGATFRAFSWRELAPSLMSLALLGVASFGAGLALLRARSR